MSDGNLLNDLPASQSDEVFEQLLSGSDFKLERIVSTGQTTEPGHWYDQEMDEWVVIVAGSARLRFEDEREDRELRVGHWVHIAAHRRHRVEWTSLNEATVWLALHYRSARADKTGATVR